MNILGELAGGLTSNRSLSCQQSNIPFGKVVYK
jgi:hypothetical protein